MIRKKLEKHDPYLIFVWANFFNDSAQCGFLGAPLMVTILPYQHLRRRMPESDKSLTTMLFISIPFICCRSLKSGVALFFGPCNNARNSFLMLENRKSIINSTRLLRRKKRLPFSPGSKSPGKCKSHITMCFSGILWPFGCHNLTPPQPQ